MSRGAGVMGALFRSFGPIWLISDVLLGTP